MKNKGSFAWKIVSEVLCSFLALAIHELYTWFFRLFSHEKLNHVRTYLHLHSKGILGILDARKSLVWYKSFKKKQVCPERELQKKELARSHYRSLKTNKFSLQVTLSWKQVEIVEQNISPGIWEAKILFPSKLNSFHVHYLCLLCSFLIQAKTKIFSLL